MNGLFSLPLPPAEPGRRPLRAEPSGSEMPAQEQFFAGPENALVRALATAAVADPPIYNPIVLYGATGVGKSSVALALAVTRRHVLQLDSAIMTTGADFARDLAEAVETASVNDLRAKYHRCDLLLIDDLHQLVSKLPAQQFLLVAMDALVRRGSLVIVTLRAALGGTRRVAGLTLPLLSRLSGGLVVPLAPPGPLARRELVRQAAARLDLTLGDDAFAQLTEPTGGRLQRLQTATQIRHAVLQLAINSKSKHVETVRVSELLDDETPETKTVCRQVATTVARHFRLTVRQLRSKSRQQTTAEARSLAMYLARRLTGASYAEIGRHFGNRDHTTVLHACRKLEQVTSNDESTRRLADELAIQISMQASN